MTDVWRGVVAALAYVALILASWPLHPLAHFLVMGVALGSLLAWTNAAKQRDELKALIAEMKRVNA